MIPRCLNALCKVSEDWSGNVAPLLSSDYSVALQLF